MDNLSQSSKSDHMWDDGHYAGFFRRVIAAFIDLFIVANIGRIIGSRIFSPENLMLAVFSFTVGLVYFALMESSSLQATIGKLFMKIKVTNLEENRINIFQASLRYFLKFLSLVLLGIGLLMVIWTDRKQALHDIIVKTLVIMK